MSAAPRYTYVAVAGAAIFGPPGGESLHRALKVVHELRSGKMEWIGKERWAEVERILQLGSSGRRYWRWRDGAWSTDFWRTPTAADLARWDGGEGR